MVDAAQKQQVESEKIKRWHAYLQQPISSEAYDNAMNKFMRGEILSRADKERELDELFFGTPLSLEYLVYFETQPAEIRAAYIERKKQYDDFIQKGTMYSLVHHRMNLPFYPQNDLPPFIVFQEGQGLLEYAAKIKSNQFDVYNGSAEEPVFNREACIDLLLFAYRDITAADKEKIISFFTPEEKKWFEIKKEEITAFVDAAVEGRFPHRPLIISDKISFYEQKYLSNSQFSEEAWNKIIYGYGTDVLTAGGMSSVEKKEEILNNLSPADRGRIQNRIYEAGKYLYGKVADKALLRWCQTGLSATEKKLLEISELAALAQYPAPNPRLLFVGQTGHALTAQEIQQLQDKINMWFLDDKYEAPVLAAFQEMMKYPTGREQIRQIIAHSDYQFYIRSGAGVDKYCTKNNVSGYNGGWATSVPSFILNSDRMTLGRVLLHEILHDRSYSERPVGNFLLADAETQALNAQLDLETNMDSNSAYQLSYQINLKKWAQIVAKNGVDKPNWAFDFKPVKGLSPEELKQAKACYIQQMAAMETRTQIMEDFYAPRIALNREPSLPVRSYELLEDSLYYDSLDVQERRLLKSQLPEDMVTYLKKYYPSLDIPKMKRHASELYAEHNGRQRYRNMKYTWHEDIIRDLPNKASASQYDTPLYNAESSYLERYHRTFTNILNADVSNSTKLYLMLRILEITQNDPFIHQELLKRFRQETGFENFEKEKTQAHNSNQQEKGKGLCGTLETTGICITNTPQEDINTTILPLEKTTVLS